MDVFINKVYIFTNVVYLLFLLFSSYLLRKNTYHYIDVKLVSLQLNLKATELPINQQFVQT